MLIGLTSQPKTLPSKYFYDRRGSQLFDAICELDEYYLTRTELAIMRAHAGDMAERIGPGCLLIELGSGSSGKTRLVLDELQSPAGYVPVDVSAEHLADAADAIAADYPHIEVTPICADFNTDFDLPMHDKSAVRKVVYFPGSTIGNFTPPESRALFRRMAVMVGRGGGLLIGMDLKKDPQIIEAAYNDARGVTAAFNLNLLAHVNCALGADFALDGFEHHAFYNAEQGRIEMHLRSRRDQIVRLGDTYIRFGAGETIRTEYSHKFDVDDVARLASAGGFVAEQAWTDRDEQFSVQWLVVA